MTTEYRVASIAWPDGDFEMRAVGEGMEFRGYAAVFDSQSEDLGGFRETIRPGAFTRSLNAAANGSADIRMFWNHDSGRPLGSTKARTLRLTQDDRGLLAEATLPDTSDGRDMAELIRRGDVRSMSFGFMVGKGGDVWSDDHRQRTLVDVRLLEASPVTGWPAYPATTASIRHMLGPVDWTQDDNVRAILDGLDDEGLAAFRRCLLPAPVAPDPWVVERLAALAAKAP